MGIWGGGQHLCMLSVVERGRSQIQIPEKQVKRDSTPRVSVLGASGLPKLGKSGCSNLFSVDTLCSFGDVLFNIFLFSKISLNSNF